MVIEKSMFHSGWMLMLVLTIHTRPTVHQRPLKPIPMHILSLLLSTENLFTIKLFALKRHQVILRYSRIFISYKIHIRFNNNVLVYSVWSEYSSCSATCGEGTTTRTRTCIGGICSRATQADLIENSICNERGCKYLVVQNWFHRGLHFGMTMLFKVFLVGLPGRVASEIYVAQEPKEEKELALMVLPATVVMVQYWLRMSLAATNAVSSKSF